MALKVISSNAFQMGSHSEDNELRKERLIDVIRKENFDVAGFQEIWFEKDFNTIFDEFKNNYDFFVSFNKKSLSISKFTNYSGLVLMSKREFKDKRFFEYSKQSLLECAKKGIQKGTIRYKSKNVALFNTHMAFNNLLAIPYKINEAFLFKLQINMSKQSEIQKSQTNELKSVVNKGVGPRIIMGDFNTFENYRDVLPDGFKIVSQIDESTRSNENPYSSVGFNVAFKNKYVSDVIMASNEFECLENKLIKKPVVSDHYIISSRLDL